MQLVVLDYNRSTVEFYNIPKDWDSDKIEEFIVKKEHKLSECNWMYSEEIEIINHDGR